MTNVAGGNATVEAQIGVVQGNAVFHRHETVYRADPGDTPERRLQVALATLDAGSARAAQRLLHDLLVGERPSTRIAYYSAMAVLHGRSARDLGSIEFGELDIARRVASRLPRDDWLGALEAVLDLVGHTDDRRTEVLARLEGLPRERYTEIVRHLDLVLDGVHEGRAHQVRKRVVEEQRHEGDRRRQAWKFFEPNPAPPRQAPRMPVGARFSGAVGVLALLLAAAAVVHPLLTGSGSYFEALLYFNDMVLFLPIVTLTGAVLIGASWQSWAFSSWEEGRAPGSDMPIRGTEAEREFAAEVIRLVDVQLRKRSWTGDTAQALRAAGWSLAREVVETYGREGVAASEINWLIRTRIDELNEGRVRSLDKKSSMRSWIACAVGIALVATVVALIFMEYEDGYRGIALSLSAVALALAGHGVGDLVAAVRRRSELKRERVRCFRQDQGVHTALVEALRTKPSDARIARWLDHDKSAIRMSALHRCGLSTRDVLAQVTLIEGARDAARARVLLGPPRYSAYVVRVFFLTARGVRQIEVDLDLLDGSVHNERRASFRYDALASARVSEVGVRFAKGLRQLVVPDQAPVDDDDALVLSQAFSLSLVNGESITVVVENFEGLRDAEVESLDQLRHLALDTAGVVDALRVLEAVASEGQEWTARELDQRHWRRSDPVAAPGS
ncbi:hypothetical protein [Saccharothrix lopnurensis]|uniref:Uncharacterized protein n=1 Tax=Saccharothrix lopnurensis TaxID=1670621 RepID=A0ABW1P241_9PSEU